MKKLLNKLCEWFGHKLELTYSSEEMWLFCTRCKHTEDVPKEREEEAYARIRTRDFKWKNEK